LAVPEFQSFMLPLLRFAADGQVHSLAEARAQLALDMGLSASDLDEVLPSGGQTRFSNRVTWAKVYLAQAGLLLAPQRGRFQITDRGRGVLQTPPTRIDIKYLEQFAEFADFRSRKVSSDSKALAPTPGDNGDETPEEALDAAHLQMTASLATEVLDRVKAGAPAFFERLVVALLLEMGYGGSRADAGQAVGKSGDEGIDGVISEDRLGLDLVYLQAKKWDSTVGRPEIQRFVGALHGKRAKKGVFITTGSYSAEALAYVEHLDPKVVLIDGRRLAELMIAFEVGVATVRTYHVKRLDSDYFDEG
jgi:restriction system protein